MLTEFSNSPLSLIPPFTAIILAVLTRRVLFSVGCGVILGALMLYQFDIASTLSYLQQRFVNHFIDNNALQLDNINLILFLLLMGIMTQFMLGLGASKGFADKISRHIKSRQLAQWLINLLAVVFFIDDYLHSLLAGNISRPIADRYQISRAKLAYLLDSTAATLCVITPISSWGGYIIGLITTILVTHKIQDMSAMSVFISLIPMMFYTWFTLCIVGLMSHFNINIGPMATHEYIATRQRSKKLVPENTSQADTSLFNVLAPVFATTFVTIVMMVYTGAQALVNEGKPFAFFASLERTNIGMSIVIGALVGLALLIKPCVKCMRFPQFLEHSKKGVGLMMPAIIILLFAWTMGGVVNDVGTGKFLASLTQEYVSASWLPFLMFALAGFMALATGTSLGTFGIMLPLAADVAIATDIQLLFPVMAAVLSGAVFGDHCSPISDTTILSASGAGCNHIDHVVTQAPYAVIGAIISSLAYLVLGFTQSVSLSFCAGIVGLLLVSFPFIYKSEKKIMLPS